MSWLNVGCGTHRAPEPWVNLDVVSNDEVRPDRVVPRGPLPFGDGSAERVYLGHVLEHVPWRDVRGFLADVRRVLGDGGQVLVAGPDVLRSLELWKADSPWVPTELLRSVLEHADAADPDWPEAAHQWNCHEARVAAALEAAGFHAVKPVPVDRVVEFARDGRWPVVAWSPWQFAVAAER